MESRTILQAEILNLTQDYRQKYLTLQNIKGKNIFLLNKRSFSSYTRSQNIDQMRNIQ